ncbi:MAG: YbaN family protein [Bacteroidales bacterium]|nr:YbaN family protein [Bacteroidales bacterium]
MKKLLLKTLGIISLTLAIIGIFLPILPTTPFLLLSSFLFVRSSDKLYNWLINHRIFGQYIKDYQLNKTIPLKVKISSLSLLWVTITISALCFVNIIWVKFLLFAIAIGVSIHILHYKTKK